MKKRYLVVGIALVGFALQLLYKFPKSGDSTSVFNFFNSKIAEGDSRWIDRETFDKLPDLHVDLSGHTKNNEFVYREFKIDIPHAVSPSKGMIVTKSMDGTTNYKEVDIHSDGTLWHGDHNYVHAFNAGYGEKFQLVVCSIDSNRKPIPLAKLKFIPFPAIYNGKDSRIVQLQPCEHQGFKFKTCGCGFEPKTKISIDLFSGEDKKSFEIVTDENRSFILDIFPAVNGATDGSFALVGKENGEVTFEVDHYWGKIAFQDVAHYPELEKKYPKPIR